MTTSNIKYAVDLSDEGLSLWRRDKEKAWQLLGKAALSSPSFSDDIDKLKIGQHPNNGNKFIVQVRIPRSEVFVSNIDLSGVKGAARTSKIKKFLSDNTPYKANDLVYDLEPEKGAKKTFIAAITKQTISEAKEFISGYGFEVLYYTTKIDKAEFPKKPRFYDGDKPAITAPPVADKPKKPTKKPSKPTGKSKEPVEKPTSNDIPKPVEIDVPPPPVAPLKAAQIKTADKTQGFASKDADPKDTNPPEVTEKPADNKTPLATSNKTDLSNFETVRSKTLAAPNKLGGKIEPTIAKAPPAPPRRISIINPKPETAETAKTISASATPKPLKMPQGEKLQTDVGGFFKPRYILILLAVIIVALIYWFYTALLDGKEDIARLQQSPVIDAASEPAVVAQPDGLEQSASEDTLPILQQAADVQASQTPSLVAPLPKVEPEPVIVVSDAVKSTANPIVPGSNGNAKIANPDQEQTTVETTVSEAPQTESKKTQDTETSSQEPTKTVAEVTPQPETVNVPLVPTKEGTPGAEGITLYAGQPDIVPPRREQLKVSTDPLKGILPKMRSAKFEETYKGRSVIEPEPAIATETTTEADPNGTEVATETGAPDLLALADPNLKSSLPKLRPASVSKKAQEEKISLLTKADPSLANIKPKRRPGNLVIPKVEAKPAKLDPSEIEVAVRQALLDVARPKSRPRSLRRTVARTKAAAKAKQQNTQTASLTPATALNTSKTSAPSAVNVQKEATERSGFSKRRMSLIGVYGTASNRRALVRLPSGRYVKIKPGQQVSGWKVSAIGESSVRITKGNRNQVLRMPK